MKITLITKSNINNYKEMIMKTMRWVLIIVGELFFLTVVIFFIVSKEATYKEDLTWFNGHLFRVEQISIPEMTITDCEWEEVRGWNNAVMAYGGYYLRAWRLHPLYPDYYQYVRKSIICPWRWWFTLDKIEVNTPLTLVFYPRKDKDLVVPIFICIFIIAFLYVIYLSPK